MSRISKKEAKQLVKEFDKIHTDCSNRGNWKHKDIKTVLDTWFYKNHNMVEIYRIANGKT